MGHMSVILLNLGKYSIVPSQFEIFFIMVEILMALVLLSKVGPAAKVDFNFQNVTLPYCK